MAGVTIERGQEWGEPGLLPEHGVVVRSDAEARAVVEEHRRASKEVPPLGLVGGDLCRTLGGSADPARLRQDGARRLPIDLGAALIDGRLHWFVAHLVAHRGLWRGEAWLACNAQWWGNWNVAPGAHPDDGQLSIVEAAVPVGDRLKVRARLRSGNHLPHPSIRVRRLRAAQVEWAIPRSVWLDGERVGSGRRISVRVEPDAATVVIG
jgi:diacylglycerol kinase family enzyme